MLTIKTGTCPYAKSISHNLDFNTGAGTQHKHEQWEFKPSSRIATQDIRDCMFYLRNQEKQTSMEKSSKKHSYKPIHTFRMGTKPKTRQEAF